MTGFDYTSIVKDNNIKFKSLNLVSPDIKITKTRQSTGNKGKGGSPVSFGEIFSEHLNITNAGIEYINKINDSHLKSSFILLDIEGLASDKEYNINAKKVLLEKPVISLTSSNVPDIQPTKNKKNPISFNNKIKIGELEISDLLADIHRSDLELISSVSSFKMKGLNKSKAAFNLNDADIIKPFVRLTQYSVSQQDSTDQPEDKKTIYEKIGNFAEIIHIKRFNLIDADLDYKNMINGKLNNNRQVNSTDMNFTDLYVNTNEKTFKLGDIDFRSKNLDFPLDNGFYTLKIGDINLNKSNKSLDVNHIRLTSTYPKEEFAYRHPKHTDWFDVTVGNIHADGADISGYFKNNVLNIDGLYINDITLLNFKNRKIDVEHKVMPLVYEPLQKLPVKLNITDFDVKNFNVVYEELAPKGSVPGKISISDLNGKFSGFTNIESDSNRFIRLDADGKLMGTGYFTAVWEIPVAPSNDQFLLSAHLTNFDLRDMNDIITPLAPARVETGTLNDLIFGTIATSKKADVSMTFLYNDLKLNMLKNKNGEQVPNGFLSKLINWVVRDDNPKNGKNEHIRESHISIERDPEHSTFNYFWQILRPPLIETIGVSRGKQKMISNISGFISKVKGIFNPKKNNNESEENLHDSD
jgi:hypothetical protein